MTSGVVHFVHRALVAGVVVDHICVNIEIEMCNNREQRYNKYQGLKTPPAGPSALRRGAHGGCHELGLAYESPTVGGMNLHVF